MLLSAAGRHRSAAVPDRPRAPQAGVRPAQHGVLQVRQWTVNKTAVAEWPRQDSDELDAEQDPGCSFDTPANHLSRGRLPAPTLVHPAATSSPTDSHHAGCPAACPSKRRSGTPATATRAARPGRRGRASRATSRTSLWTPRHRCTAQQALRPAQRTLPPARGAGDQCRRIGRVTDHLHVLAQCTNTAVIQC